jgi:hypothetical protein
VRLSSSHRGPSEIAAFDVHHVAAARRRALHAAAGVYAEHERAAAAADPAGGEWMPTIRPEQLDTASGVGGSLTDRHAFVEAASLLTRQPYLVPTAAVHPFGPENSAVIFTPSRAGTGAGASLVEALQNGLLSALCHRALIGATRGASLARIALDTAGASPELAFLTKSARNLGVELELLDLRAGPAHALLARAEDPHGGPTLWSLAAHPWFTRAAVAAVRDLLGRVQLSRQLPAGQFVDDGDPMLADFAAGTLIAGTEQPARLDSTGTCGDVLDGLRGAGSDVLVVPTTPADLRAGGIETVRVLLTGVAGEER